MAYKIPRPKRNDVVERIDFSRMFGRVKKIQSPDKVVVEWADDEKPKLTKEKIKDLALVKRK